MEQAMDHPPDDLDNEKLSISLQAFIRNKSKVIECSECCTRFIMWDDGSWATKDRHKVATLIGKSLQCTCGTIIAIKLDKDAIPDEFIGLIL